MSKPVSPFREFVRNLLTRAGGGPGSLGSTSRAVERARVGTGFEALESRQMLTAYTWDGGGAFGLTLDFNNGQNWSPNGVPGVEDSAFIGEGDFRVAVTASVEVRFLVSEVPILLGSAVTLELGDNPLPNRIAGLDQEGGTLAGGDLEITGPAHFWGGLVNNFGFIILSGDSEWTGGLMHGTGDLVVDQGASLDISAGTVLQRDLVNFGTISVSSLFSVFQHDIENFGTINRSAFDVSLNEAAIFNRPGGVFNAAGDGDIIGESGSCRVINEGTLNKSGAGLLNIRRASVGGVFPSFINTGTVAVSGGELDIEVFAAGQMGGFGTTTLLSGAWSVANDGVLSFPSGVTIQTIGLNASVTLEGPAVSFNALASLRTNQGEFVLVGHNFHFVNTFSNDGTFVLRNGMASLSATISDFYNSDGGIVDLESGSLGISNASTLGAINVGAGATLRFAGTVDHYGDILGEGSLELDSYNTIFDGCEWSVAHISTDPFVGIFGTGVLTISGTMDWGGGPLQAPLRNLGTLHILGSAGTQVVGSVENLGAIQIDLGAELQFPSSSTATHGAGSSITGTGTLTLGPVVHTITGPTTWSVPTVSVPSGTIITGPGDLTITGAFAWTGNSAGSLTGSGQTILAAGGPDFIMSAGNTYDLQRPLTIDRFWNFDGGTVTGPANLVIGAGFRWVSPEVMSGTGLTILEENGIGVHLAGTLTSDRDLVFNRPFTMLGGTLLGAGDVTFGRTLTWTSGTLGGTGIAIVTRAFSVAGATCTANRDITFNGPVTLSGGLLTGTGDLTFAGGLNWSGGTLGGTGIALVTQASSVAGATCTANRDMTFEGPVTLSSGTLTGTGDMTFAGGLTWSGGTLGGTGLAIVASGTVLDRTGGDLARDLDNFGTFNCGGSDLQISGGAVITNRAGGVFHHQSSTDLFGIGAPPMFINEGQYIRNSFGQINFVGVSVTNAAGAEMRVIIGTLGFGIGSGLLNLGHIELEAGTGLTFSAGSSATHGAGSSIGGPGDLALGPVTHTVTGATTWSVPTVSVPTGTSITGPGDLTITGAFAWTGTSGGSLTGSGQTILAAGGPDFAMTGGLIFDLQRPLRIDRDWLLQDATVTGPADLSINGAYTWHPTGVQSGVGRTIFGEPGAIGSVSLGSVYSDRDLVYNRPAILSGASRTGAGNLTFNANFTWTSGTLGGTGVAIVNGLTSFSGGSCTANRNITFNGPVNLSSGTVGGTGDLTFAGALTWTGGSLDGSGMATIAPGATANYAGGTLSRRLLNSGSLSIVGGATLTVVGVFDNLGIIQIDSGATLQFNSGAAATHGPGSSITGTGTLTLGPVIHSVTGATTWSVPAVSVPTGTTITGPGDLTITDVFIWTGASGGSLTGSGQTILAAGGPQFNMDAGNTFDLQRTLTINRAWLLTGGATVTGPANLYINGSWSWNTSAVQSGAGLTIWGPTAGPVTFVSGTFQSDRDLVFNATFELSGGTFVGSGDLTFGLNLTWTAGTLGGTGAATVLGAASISSGTCTADRNITFNGGLTITSGTLTGSGDVMVNGAFSWTDGLQAGAGTTTVGPGAAFTLSSGTRTSNRPIVFNRAFQLSGGTFNGLGTVTFAGGLNWSGGSMGGSGLAVIPAGQVLALSGGSGLFRSLDNFGTINYTSGLGIFNGSVLTNKPGATFNHLGPTDFSGGGSYSRFVNHGTYNKTGGGPYGFSGQLYVNNEASGVMNVTAGTLVLTNSDAPNYVNISNAGRFVVAPGATLRLAHGVDHQNGSKILGTGTVDFTFGTHVISDQVEVAPTLVLTFTGGIVSLNQNRTFDYLVRLEGGALKGTGDFTFAAGLDWTNGALGGPDTPGGEGRATIPAGQVLNYSGGSETRRSIDNFGTINATNSFAIRDGKILTNKPGATFNAGQAANSNASISGSTSTSYSQFINQGTYNKTGGGQYGFSSQIVLINAPTGVINIDAGIFEWSNADQFGIEFFNSGRIDIDAGTTFRFTRGASHADGSFIVGAGTVDFNYGTHVFSDQVQLSAVMKLTGGIVTLNQNRTFDYLVRLEGGALKGIGDFTFAAGFDWTNGALGGPDTPGGEGRATIPAGQVLNYSGGSETRRSIDNFGTINATNSFAIRDGKILTNKPGATFNAGQAANSNANISGSTSTSYSQFINQGTYNKTGGGQYGFSSQIVLINAPTGVINIDAGIFEWSNADQFGIEFFNSGRIDIDAGTTFRFTRGASHADGSFIVGSGIVDFNYGTHVFSDQVQLSAVMKLTGGIVSLNQNRTFDYLVRLEGGALKGTGDFTFAAGLDWTNGALGGPDTPGGEGRATILAGQVLNYSGGSETRRSIDNFGTINATNSFAIRDGKILTNKPGATFNAGQAANSNASISGSTSTSYSQFINQGTYNKTGGGQYGFSSQIVLINAPTGVINIDAGIFEWSNADQFGIEFFNSGRIDIDAGTTFRFTRGASHADGSFIVGAGTVDFNYGTHVLSSLVSLQSTVVMTFTGGAVTLNQNFTFGYPLTLSGGTLSGSGDLTINGGLAWTGGIMAGSGKVIIPSGQSITLTSNTVTLNRSLDNFGTITVTGPSGSSMTIGAGAVLTNKPGGVFNHNFAGNLHGSGDNPFESFLNQGTYNRNSAGAGGFSFDLLVTNAAGGVMNFNAGSHSWNTFYSATNQGTLNVADGATLSITSNLSLFSGGTLLGGAWNIAGTLSLPGSTSITAIGAGASVQIDGPSAVITRASGGSAVAALASNAGTLTLANNAPWLFISTGNFSNSGSFRKAGAGLVTFPAALVFNSTGLVDVTGGAANFPAALNNSGQVSVTAGSLSLSGGGTHAGDFAIAGAGVVSLAGTHSFAAGSDITGAGTLFITGGTISSLGTLSITGPASFLAGSSTFSGTFAIGALSISSGASVTLKSNSSSGSVSNAGTLSLGTRTLAVNGTFTQTGSGTLRLSGTGFSTGRFGRVVATGAVALAGTLDVTFTFPIAAGQFGSAQLVTGSSVNGTFSTVAVHTPDNRAWDLLYGPSGVTLEFVRESKFQID